MTARVPRLLVKSGRTVTTRVPWAAPRRRFTLSFEAHVIALLQHCRTVRGEARLARITENAADGVMRRAVERGLLRRQLQPPALLGFDEPERSGDKTARGGPEGCAERIKRRSARAPLSAYPDGCGKWLHD